MTQNTQWLFVVGIVIGAIGVVVAGSAVGAVLGDEPTQDHTGFEHPHANGDQYDTTHAHADDDRHRHSDDAQQSHRDGVDEWQHHHDGIGNHPPTGDDLRGPHHTDGESATRGGPCHR